MAKHKLCYERKNKKGEIISYRFFYNGKDSFTDKPKQYTRTWKVPHGLTARQIEFERKKAELEFIQECEKKTNGTSLQDSNITFEEFSKEWFDRILKKNEEGYSYYVRAKNTLPLLNEFFGKYQLKAINARMVQRFYDYLCDRTYTKEIVTVKKSINELIEAQQLNKTQIAKECGIDRLTLRLSTKIGQQVSITTARTVCKYFNVPLVNYFQAERKDIKYSKSTNQAVKTLLVVILGEAKRQQLIEHNYASKDFTQPVTGTTKQKEIFEEEETKAFVRAVMEESNQKKKTVLSLLIFLGLRKAEICGLSWNDISFENKILRVAHNSVYFPEFGVVTKKPKTKNSERTIRLPEQLVIILSDYKVWYDEQKELHGDLWEHTDRLFIQDNGNPMCPSSVNHWLRDFNAEHGFNNISPHALRHTCITMQINAGIPIKTVSARAGHANERITLNIYTHALQSQDDRAAEIYNDYLLSSQ